MSDVSQFRSKTTYDGFEWTVKLVDDIEGYLVTATDTVEATAVGTAKTALKQKYLDDAKAVPSWLDS
jgi:hypothetical protein